MNDKTLLQQSIDAVNAELREGRAMNLAALKQELSEIMESRAAHDDADKPYPMGQTEHLEEVKALIAKHDPRYEAGKKLTVPELIAKLRRPKENT